MRTELRNFLLAAALLAPLSLTHAAPTPPFRLYMAPIPAGNDGNDGLSPRTAVYSLNRVESLIQLHHPATDIEVRIEPGTYIAATKFWRTYIPGHTISFMPADYVYGEGGSGVAGREVFENAKTCSGYCGGFWFQARLPVAATDPVHNGGKSGLRFYYLKVEDYPSGGISIFGDSERPTENDAYSPPIQIRATNGLNSNLFFGMQFTHLGTRWANGPNYQGYGAIVLENSSDNVIEDNDFSGIDNVPAYEPLIHGLYITHFSSKNTVEQNAFSYIGGDPVKVRDMSNFNVIERNTFIGTKDQALYTDEFCDTACAIKYKLPRQCASFGNLFVDNQLVSAAAAVPETWLLSPAGPDYAGAAPCRIPSGEERLRASGNTDRIAGTAASAAHTIAIHGTQ
jgi:hypothetical protein